MKWTDVVLLLSLLLTSSRLPATAAESLPALRPALSADSEKLTLWQALNEGLANSPRTAAARAQLGITKSNLVQANVLPNPGVFIDNQYQFTYKLGVSMLVEPPWRLVFRRAAAKKQITQTDLEISRTLWLFRGDVRRTYCEAVIAREMASVRRQLLEIMRRLQTIAKERFDNGDVPRLDVHRAELAVIQAELQVEQADILVTQANEQLSILLARQNFNVAPAPLKEITDELISHAGKLNSQRDLLQAAHNNRLELKIVVQQNLVNDANLKVARGNILPAPRFTVGGMTEDHINSPLNRKTVFFQSLVELPVLDRQQGLIARAKATGEQLHFELLSQQNIINAQVCLALRKLQTAVVRIEKYRDHAIPVSDTISTAADLSYRIGQTDINSALLAQQENIIVQTQYLDSLLACELAMNDLEQAIGIPLQ
jgi:cobalt-zinc-cadmium resistance protein CzcA